MNNKVKFLRGTSDEYAVVEKDSDTIYFTTDDGKLYIGDKEISGGGSITIDNALSDTSENAVQNKVIKAGLDEKANSTDLTSHTSNTVSHITSTERTNWNSAKTHADSAHAPSDAQANVIESIKVNGTALTPSSKAVDITVPSYSTMTGATSSSAGTSGLVPAPASGKQASYLRGDGTWAVPTNTDTKVTNTLNTTTKAYITGTISDSTNTGTQIFDTGVYLDTTAGTLTATTFKGALSGNASTSSKLESSSYTTITINSSDWTTNSDGGYMYEYTLPTSMPYENFNFDVVLSTDQSAAKLQIEAWNCVIADGRIDQYEESFTSIGGDSYSYTTAFIFYAFTTKPSVALTIAVQGVS